MLRSQPDFIPLATAHLCSWREKQNKTKEGRGSKKPPIGWSPGLGSPTGEGNFQNCAGNTSSGEIWQPVWRLQAFWISVQTPSTFLRLLCDPFEVYPTWKNLLENWGQLKDFLWKSLWMCPVAFSQGGQPIRTRNLKSRERRSLRQNVSIINLLPPFFSS